MVNTNHSTSKMDGLLQRLIERDMILEDKDEAKELVQYANQRGYNARYFEHRNRPHVDLKREAPHRPIDKPIKQRK